MSRLRTVLPWVWTGIVAIAVVAAGFVADIHGNAELASGVFFAAVSVLLCGLGALLATRQPGRLSWIFLVVGSGGALLQLLPNVETAGPENSRWEHLGTYLVENFGLSLIIFPLLLLLFVFPTGSFIGRRWAWLPVAVGLGGAISLVVGLFSAETWEPFSPPFGVIPTTVSDAVFGAWFAGLVAMAPTGAASMVVRFRRASPVVRAQIKWVLLSLFIYAMAFIAIVAGVASGTEWFALLFIGPIALIAIAVTIAITKYKLFEIDRIISRTVAYTLVIAVLALVFAAGVTWIPTALSLNDSSLLVAGSTLAVAALFNPLRKRIQRAVDRRFNRSSYQAELVSEQFSAKLRESLTVDELAEVWSETVDHHLQPAASGIWLRKDRQQ